MVPTDKDSPVTLEYVFFLGVLSGTLFRQGAPDPVSMQVFPQLNLFSEPLLKLAKNCGLKLSALMEAQHRNRD
mgnify:CR=1 FL=1